MLKFKNLMLLLKGGPAMRIVNIVFSGLCILLSRHFLDDAHFAFAGFYQMLAVFGQQIVEFGLSAFWVRSLQDARENVDAVGVLGFKLVNSILYSIAISVLGVLFFPIQYRLEFGVWPLVCVMLFLSANQFLWYCMWKREVWRYYKICAEARAVNLVLLGVLLPVFRSGLFDIVAFAVAQAYLLVRSVIFMRHSLGGAVSGFVSCLLDLFASYRGRWFVDARWLVGCFLSTLLYGYADQFVVALLLGVEDYSLYRFVMYFIAAINSVFMASHQAYFSELNPRNRRMVLGYFKRMLFLYVLTVFCFFVLSVVGFGKNWGGGYVDSEFFILMFYMAAAKLLMIVGAPFLWWMRKAGLDREQFLIMVCAGLGALVSYFLWAENGGTGMVAVIVFCSELFVVGGAVSVFLRSETFSKA